MYIVSFINLVVFNKHLYKSSLALMQNENNYSYHTITRFDFNHYWL
jgi:hypothetical protein